MAVIGILSLLFVGGSFLLNPLDHISKEKK